MIDSTILRSSLDMKSRAQSIYYFIGEGNKKERGCRCGCLGRVKCKTGWWRGIGEGTDEENEAKTINYSHYWYRRASEWATSLGR